MKIFINTSCCAIACLLSLSAYAAETLPTSSSKPLPSLQVTQNIDTVLSEHVQAKIASSPLLKGQAVSAGSRDQIVTLEGSVETEQQEQEAINLAKSVNGVKEVKSQLTIKVINKETEKK